MSEVSLISINTIGDLKDLINVFSRAFESTYQVRDQYLEELLKSPSTSIFGAVKNGKIVGGIVACEILPIHGSKEIYIYDIAVDPDFQQQGIGRMLIHKLKEHGKKIGAETIFVEAESDDIGAVTFYRKMNGEELSVSHFNFKVNKSD